VKDLFLPIEKNFNFEGLVFKCFSKFDTNKIGKEFEIGGPQNFKCDDEWNNENSKTIMMLSVVVCAHRHTMMRRP
jgi:hypothetical protein